MTWTQNFIRRLAVELEGFKVAWLAIVNDFDSLYNGICYRPFSVESRTENLISIGHSVAEILNVKVRKSSTLVTTFFLFSSFLSKSSCQYGG